MLTIIPDTNRIIQKGWIKYYEFLPEKDPDFTFCSAATGIDPAVSQKDWADFTAMVSAKIYFHQDQLRLYILPHPVNERLSTHQSLRRAKEISERLGQGNQTVLYIEDVGTQRFFIDSVKKEGCPVQPVPTLGIDKRNRLMAVSQYLEMGQVYFPKQGAEVLISQLLGFGAEKHDDLVDAFTIIVGELFKRSHLPTSWPEDTDDHSDSRLTFDGLLDQQF